MFGAPLDGPPHTRCDDQSAVTNAPVPAPTLGEGDNAVASRHVRGGAAAGVIDVCKCQARTATQAVLRRGLLPLPLVRRSLAPLCH